MILLPPRSTRTDTLFPSPTLFRSHHNAEYRISSEAGVQIYASPGSNLDRFARIARPVENITIETVGIWKDHGATFRGAVRSEEHTSELQSLMRISYAVFCLKKKINKYTYRQ